MGMRVVTKPVRRPKKNETDRRRREKVQKKRLVALGMPEAEVSRLNSRRVKDLLQRPVRLKQRLAAGKPALA